MALFRCIEKPKTLQDSSSHRILQHLHRILPCVWLESGASRFRVNPFLWLFGWRMRGLSWLQSGIFLSDAGWTRPSKSGGRSRSSQVDVHQTLNPSTKHWTEPLRSQSFNQTLKRVESVPKIEVQPNTLLGWLRPQKLGWIEPNPPNLQPNTRLNIDKKDN